jgi:hypothetical protein
MSETELAGAALPEGIEVDETSAYFGVTKSSDILNELQQIDRHVALARFIELTADLHLSSVEFDYTAASERMNCEGGEIYYLVVSHFRFTAMCDPLRIFLGMEDSEGNPGDACQLPPEEIELLTNLTNAMPLLGLMAIGFLTAGQGMVVTYARTLESLLINPSANLATLLEIGQGYVNALANAREGNYPEPIEVLTIGGEAVFSSDATSQPNVPLPGGQPEIASPPPSIPTATVASPAQVQAEVDVPLPEATPSVPELTPEIPVPLPTDGSETISKPPQVDDDVPVDDLTVRQVEVRADNVFDDAFGNALSIEQESAAPAESAPAPSPEAVAAPPSDPVVEPEPSAPDESVPEPVAPVESVPELATTAETEPTLPTPAVSPVQAPSPGREPELDRSPSMGEKVLDFLAADTDGDGHLSKDEVVQMVGDSETADEFIKAADTDGDGEISLPEFISATTDSSVAEGEEVAVISLPRPVTPLRRPVSDDKVMNVGRTTALAGSQYVIKSGIHCGGCGIGIDPHWRHCVVCGVGR